MNALLTILLQPPIMFRVAHGTLGVAGMFGTMLAVAVLSRALAGPAVAILFQATIVIGILDRAARVGVLVLSH